jgi:hypothetical protein
MLKMLNYWRNKVPNIKFYYSPDSDHLNQILEEYHSMKGRVKIITFSRVWGHQDRLHRQLTFPETLSLEADLLETDKYPFWLYQELYVPP